MPLTFFLSRFSKVKSLTAINFLLHILIYFSLQLGNFSKMYFGALYCHYLPFIEKIFVATYPIPSELETCVSFPFLFFFCSGRSETIKSLVCRGLNGKDRCLLQTCSNTGEGDEGEGKSAAIRGILVLRVHKRSVDLPPLRHPG